MSQIFKTGSKMLVQCFLCEKDDGNLVCILSCILAYLNSEISHIFFHSMLFYRPYLFSQGNKPFKHAFQNSFSGLSVVTT